MNALLTRHCGVWLLCLGLVLPGVGQAAQVEPPVSPEVPGTQADAPRRLLVDESAPEDRGREGVPRGLRILGEVGGGLLTAGALGVAVGGTAGLVCLALNQSDYGAVTCLALGLLGAGVGAGLGLSLGTWWAGELLGGDGSLLTSLGGMVAGLLSGFLLSNVAGNVLTRSPTNSAVLGLTFPVMALTGSILGYELSQRPPRRGAARGGIQPLLSFTPSATVIGLGGQF